MEEDKKVVIIRIVRTERLEFDLGEIDLKIIKADRFSLGDMNLILSELKVYLGQSTKIKIKYVSKIAMVRTGKHQGAISNIKINFQAIK